LFNLFSLLLNNLYLRRAIIIKNPHSMFGLFKKSNPKEKLEKKYRDLMGQAHKYSSTNRKLSDQKVQEAEEVMKELERLAKNQD